MGSICRIPPPYRDLACVHRRCAVRHPAHAGEDFVACAAVKYRVSDEAPLRPPEQPCWFESDPPAHHEGGECEGGQIARYSSRSALLSRTSRAAPSKATVPMSRMTARSASSRAAMVF